MSLEDQEAVPKYSNWQPDFSLQDPPWFFITGHQHVSYHWMFGYGMKAGVFLLGILMTSLFLPFPFRKICLVLAVILLVALCRDIYVRLQNKQRVRVIGNVLEHDDGQKICRISLTRATIAMMTVPPNLIVLTFHQGDSQISIGRKADAHELFHLPMQMIPCLELNPDDFEEIRRAAERFYPQA